LFTAIAAAKGLGSHTGVADDTVPEVMILMPSFEEQKINFCLFSSMKKDTALQHNISWLRVHLNESKYIRTYAIGTYI